MKKLLTFALIMVLAVSFGFAQDELTEDIKKMDAGLRFSNRPGVTARYFLSEGNSVEALLTTNRGLIVSGLYEFHKPLSIGEIENLSWFFGGGLHAGFSTWWTASLALGLDAIVGVEYDLEPLISFPITVSLDYKPSFDILGGWADTFFDTALSIRYSF